MENIFFNKKDLLQCGENVIIGKTVRIRSPEKVSIGDNTIIDDFTYISGSLDLGEYTHIASGVSIQGSKNKISIGDFTGISSGVRIYAGSSNYVEAGLDLPTIPEKHSWNGIYEDCFIDHFCVIGANSVILPGCKIPKGLTVAANLVVRKKLNLSPWHVLLDQNGKMIKRKKIQELHKRVSSLTPKKYF